MIFKNFSYLPQIETIVKGTNDKINPENPIEFKPTQKSVGITMSNNYKDTYN